MTKRPAVAFLLNSLCLGGSERKVIRIANELQQRGYEVHLICLNTSETLLESIHSSVRIHGLDRSGKFSLRAVLRLGKVLRAEHVDLIFTVNLYPIIYGVGARIVGARHPRLIALINQADFVGGRDHQVRLLYRHLLKMPSKIIFGCSTQQSQWIQKYGLDSLRCGWIYNGVDIADFDIDAPGVKAAANRLRASLFLDDSHFVIGCVGQFRPEKNQIDLIRATANLKQRIPELRLLLVGDGAERDRLRDSVASCGLDGIVSFLGAVDDPRPALALMDVFVLPSVFETFSNAALEAMAMSRASVLSDTGGAREMVDSPNGGLVYPSGDVDALCGTLSKLHKSPRARDKLGQKARLRVEDTFSSTRMFDMYADLVDQLAND